VLQSQLEDSSSEILSTLQQVVADLPTLLVGTDLVYQALMSVGGLDNSFSSSAASRLTAPEPYTSTSPASADGLSAADIHTLAARLGIMSELKAGMSTAVEVMSSPLFTEPVQLVDITSAIACI